MNKPRRPGGRAPSPSQFFRPSTTGGGGRGRGGQRAGGRGKLAKGRAGLAPPGGKMAKTAAEKEEAESEQPKAKLEPRPADRRSSFPAGVKKGGLGFAGVAMGVPIGGGGAGFGPPTGLPFKFSQFAICSALKMQGKRIRSNRSTKSMYSYCQRPFD